MMRLLKLYLFFAFSGLLIVACFISCTKQENNSPQISFTRPIYLMPANDSINIGLMLSKETKEKLIVPFKIGGSAIEKEEYVLSAHQFVVEAGKKEAFISATPKNNITSEKEIRLELEAITGYKLGAYKVSIIPIEKKQSYICSFVEPIYNMTDIATIEASLATEWEYIEYPPFQIKVPFIIDPASTAVLNEHFEIEGGEQFLIIDNNRYNAEVKLRVKKREAGKDKIVLKLVDNASFRIGENNKTIVYIKE